DAMIAGHQVFDRIELWFEHDLYDQLQLVQIIDMLAAGKRETGLFHIPSPRHLGPIPADRILDLADLTLPVNAAMTATAKNVWAAYRQPDPRELDAARKGPIAGFPFLAQALKRALQDLPDANGIGRTERQTLYTIDRGVKLPGPLFARVLNMEEAAFLGDWGFFSMLNDMVYADLPLVSGLAERFEPALMQDDERRKAFITTPVSLTAYGKAVLDGHEDHAAKNKIDKWIGGTHITNENLWRWIDETETLLPPG
ncbi:MAG: hypothetical protein GXP01_08615, partial [Alphaproteobacteria bacterium]|nr:hypothetical protein [Alphaproteobacteria bacterium]